MDLREADLEAFEKLKSQESFVGRNSYQRAKYLGAYLLHCAVFGDVNWVEKMLDEEHVPIDFADEQSGLTSLHIAVGSNHLKLAKFLVERGAKFVPDKRGRMPTTIAAECEVSDEMCDFVAEAEAIADGV